MYGSRKGNIGSNSYYLDSFLNRPGSGIAKQRSQHIQQPNTKPPPTNQIYNQTNKCEMPKNDKKLQQNCKSKDGNLEWLTHFYCEYYSFSTSAAKVADIFEKYISESKKAIIYTNEVNYGRVTNQLDYKIRRFKISAVYIAGSHKLDRLTQKRLQFMTDQYKLLISSKGSNGTFQSGVIDVEDVDLIICDDVPDHKQYRERLLRSRELSKNKRGVVITVCDPAKRDALLSYESILGIKIKKMQMTQNLSSYLLPPPKQKPTQQNPLSASSFKAIKQQPQLKKQEYENNSKKTFSQQGSRKTLSQQGNINWLTHCYTTKDYTPWTKIVNILNQNVKLYKKVIVYTETRGQKYSQLKKCLKSRLSNKSEMLTIDDQQKQNAIKNTMQIFSKSSIYRILITTRTPEILFQFAVLDVEAVNLILIDGVLESQQYRKRIARSHNFRDGKGLVVTVVDYQDTKTVDSIQNSLNIKMHNLERVSDLSEYYDYEIKMKIQNSSSPLEKLVGDSPSLESSTISTHSAQIKEFKIKQPLKLQKKEKKTEKDFNYFEDYDLKTKNNKIQKQKQKQFLFKEEKTEPKKVQQNNFLLKNKTKPQPEKQIYKQEKNQQKSSEQYSPNIRNTTLNRPISGSSDADRAPTVKKYQNPVNARPNSAFQIPPAMAHSQSQSMLLKKLQKMELTAKQNSQKQSQILQNQIDFKRNQQNLTNQVTEIRQEQRKGAFKKGQQNQIGEKIQKISKQNQKIFEAVNKRPVSSSDQAVVNNIGDSKQMWRLYREGQKESNQKIDAVVASNQNISKDQKQIKNGIDRNFKQLNSNTKLLQQLVEYSRENKKRMTTDDLAKKVEELSKPQMKICQQILQRIESLQRNFVQSQSPMIKQESSSSVDQAKLQQKQRQLKSQFQQISSYKKQLEQQKTQYQTLLQKLTQTELELKQAPKESLKSLQLQQFPQEQETGFGSFLGQSQIFEKLKEKDKQFLYDTIKKTMTSVTLPDFKLKSKTIFQSSSQDTNFWHKWMEMCCGKENFLALIQLDNGHVILGFSQAEVYEPKKQNLKVKNACLASVTNNKVYMIKGHRPKKAVYLSHYSIEFGNSELVIMGELRLISLVGKMHMCYFPVKQPTQNFLGQEISKDFDKYSANRMQFHQIFPIEIRK